MYRRQLLTTIGGATTFGLASSFVGAAGSDISVSHEDGMGNDWSGKDGEKEAVPEGGVFPEGTDPFDRVVIGNRAAVEFPENNQTQIVRLWNDQVDARQIGLRIVADDRLRVWKIVEFPGNAWMEVVLNEPARYRLAIDVEGELADLVEIGEFDCNQATTTIRVDESGSVSSSTTTTLIGCPEAELETVSIIAEAGRCSVEENAAAEFSNEAVVVTGNLLVPNPCYTAELGPAAMDGDTLTVTIMAKQTTTEACVQCVGSVPYTATMGFRNAYPRRVVVNHQANGRRRTVLDLEVE
jgi:hypothetical protein